MNLNSFCVHISEKFSGHNTTPGPAFIAQCVQMVSFLHISTPTIEISPTSRLGLLQRAYAMTTSKRTKAKVSSGSISDVDDGEDDDGEGESGMGKSGARKTKKKSADDKFWEGFQKYLRKTKSTYHGDKTGLKA
jgi:hypothetical protein